MYSDESTHISGVTVNNAPCFFNSKNNSVDMLCASVDSIKGGDSCAVIETNDVVVSVNEEEERYCDDASSIFGFTFVCVWKGDYDGEWGWCGSVYYLTNNGRVIVFSSVFLFFVLYYQVVLREVSVILLMLYDLLL
jgi:hypothetical protein